MYGKLGLSECLVTQENTEKGYPMKDTTKLLTYSSEVKVIEHFPVSKSTHNNYVPARIEFWTKMLSANVWLSTSTYSQV